MLRYTLIVAGICLKTVPLAAQVELLRGPYLQSLLDTSVAILWTTDEQCQGEVKYTTLNGPEQASREQEIGQIHLVKLEDLSPGTVYQYRILCDGEPLRGEVFQFRASPLPGEGSIRVAATGDSGIGNDDQYAVAGLIEEMAPDLFLHLGDLIYRGTEDNVIFEPYRNILSRSCFYPSRGNHDLSMDWPNLFHLPLADPERGYIYYSFDWGSAHFVALDSNYHFGGNDFQQEGILRAQLEWLEADLVEARDRGLPWIIVFFHHPPYTVGSYAWNCEDYREVVVPILDRYEVDLVLTAHDHNYQRHHPVREDVVRDAWQSPHFISPRGTIYLVSGGGGGWPYMERKNSDHKYTERFVSAFHALDLEISSTRISIKALAPGENGESIVIDSFTISKGEPPPGPEFLRGDLDFSGDLNLTDLIVFLKLLFLEEPVDCPAAGKMESLGDPISLSDLIYFLEYLFKRGPPPPAPFPRCGPAPEDDDAFCMRSGCSG